MNFRTTSCPQPLGRGQLAQYPGNSAILQQERDDHRVHKGHGYPVLRAL